MASSEQSYYHWQRRFRKQAYEEMKGNSSVPAVTEKTELSFVEIPCHTSAETNTYMVSDKPVATIRTATLQIDISNEISDAAPEPDYSGGVPCLKMLLVFAVLFLPAARLI